jgi:hypothetical protein
MSVASHQAHASSCGCAENASCRFFLCSCYRRQVLLCSQCDRGQLYCGRDCALEVRRRNQRAARARYQATIRGRELHAERSRRYRARQRCVTDQGSIPPGKPAAKANEPPLSVTRAAATAAPANTNALTLRTACQCCGKPVSNFVRLSWIRRRSRAKRSGRLRS